jgi:ABC-type transporter Mla subunit MlaD
VLEQDLRGTADLAETLDGSLDDLLRVLRNSSSISRSLVDDERALDAFLRRSAGAAGTTRAFLADNEQRLVGLARESVPNLRVYQRYAPGFPCMLAGIAGVNAEAERVFGGGQPACTSPPRSSTATASRASSPARSRCTPTTPARPASASTASRSSPSRSTATPTTATATARRSTRGRGCRRARAARRCRSRSAPPSRPPWPRRWA